ncbi:hypothetical protein JCM10908_000464, partial [Rhodotorula pacifica]|uniref:telomerase reverse transcriptase n=1 Tax=Rhodotorula pacifica TaxID=1495444 RepID=UPI003177F3EE
MSPPLAIAAAAASVNMGSSEPANTSTRSSSYTHALLNKYYSSVCTLQDLLPLGIAREEGDSESFRTLVGQTVVASRNGAEGLPKLARSTMTVGQGQGMSGASMPEIIDQVQQRLFAAHAKEYYREKKAGNIAFATPKNMLAFGYRLNTDRTRDLQRTRSQLEQGFVEVFPNTIVAMLVSSRDWDTLAHRTGPDFLIQLFSSPDLALFAPLPNACLMQISGTPTADLRMLENLEGNGVGRGKRRTEHRRRGGKRKRAKRGRKGESEIEEGEEEEGDEEGVARTEVGGIPEVRVDAPPPPPPPTPPGSTSPQNRTAVPAATTATTSAFRPCHSLPSIQPSSGPTGDALAPGPGAGIDNDSQAQAARDGRTASLSPLKRSLRATTSMGSLLSVGGGGATGAAGAGGGGGGGGGTETSERPAKRRRLETLYVTSFYLSPNSSSATPVRAYLWGAILFPGRATTTNRNSNNAIVLARHQMYHHRLSKGVGGKLIYGLNARHVLVRLPTLYPIEPSLPPTATTRNAKSKAAKPRTSPDRGTSEAAARHLAKYIFPRQFSLHNAFTSPKPRASLDVLPDYMDRELEIKRLGSVKTPPRLRPALPLLQRLGLLSSRCNFRKLLDKRCPSKLKNRQLSQEERSAVLNLSLEPRTQVSRGEVSLDTSHPSLVIPHGQTQAVAQNVKKPKLSEYACSIYEVECYVLDCVRDVIPKGFWGSEGNRKLAERNVSKLLRYRRYETISLHALLQGFSVLDCEWLGSPRRASNKTSEQPRSTAADMAKQLELLSEFMYWFFDSFIIDLVRTAFYVTDTATHQNRPLYFRQDDWNTLCAPLLKQLGDSVFEKVPV